MTTPQNPRPSVPLPGSRRFHRHGSVVLGPCDRDEWCEITIKVRRKAALPEPVAGKPIKREELASKYGAAAGDLDKVAEVVTRLGLTVVEKDAAGRAVHCVGPAATMEKIFGVRLSRVKHNDILYRGRVGEIYLPPELADVVTGVFGLDNRPMLKRRKPLRLQASTHASLPPSNQRAWFTPPELAAAYDFPAGDGGGQKIAILEFGGHFIASDLKAFLQLIDMADAAPVVKTKDVRPTLTAQDRNDPDAIGETMLDIEIVASVCPKAAITVYFCRFSEQGWVNNLTAVLLDGAPIVSISYGLAEGTDIWTQQAIDHVNDTLKEMANAGVTVCVSSGDDGSDDQVADRMAHIDFPASSPYVLSVGGTALSKALGNEVVWFDGDGLRRDGGGSTGGGVSEKNPRPAWQTMAIPCVNPPHALGRIVPDVAANAAGSTGYLMVSLNNAEVSGGTSAATPLWASLLARVQQAGKTVGFLTPRLYQPNPNTGGKPLGEVVCKDITSGENATGATEGYAADAGFDAVTGWGSPMGSEFLAKLD